MLEMEINRHREFSKKQKEMELKLIRDMSKRPDIILKKKKPSSLPNVTSCRNPLSSELETIKEFDQAESYRAKRSGRQRKGNKRVPLTY